MPESEYFWVEFNGMRVKAMNKSEAYSIVLRKLEEGDYPEIFIEQEFVTPLRAWPVHDETCDMER
jgi:hypothetical protein